MPQHTITIYSGNPSNHELKLSDNGYSEVPQYNRIHWIITPGSNVASIEKIHKKKDSPGVFIFGPSRDGNEWTGKVMFAPDSDYQYYITWIEKGTGTHHTYDPKIAVKPSFNIAFLFIIVAFILGLATIGIRRLFFAKK